jgi:hypothetical protein
MTIALGAHRLLHFSRLYSIQIFFPGIRSTMPDLCIQMWFSKVALCVLSSSTCLQCISSSRHSVVFEKNCLSSTSYKNGLPTTSYVHIRNQSLKLNTDAKVVVDRLGSEHPFCQYFDFVLSRCLQSAMYEDVMESIILFLLVRTVPILGQLRRVVLFASAKAICALPVVL